MCRGLKLGGIYSLATFQTQAEAQHKQGDDTHRESLDHEFTFLLDALPSLVSTTLGPWPAGWQIRAMYHRGLRACSRRIHVSD